MGKVTVRNTLTAISAVNPTNEMLLRELRNIPTPSLEAAIAATPCTLQRPDLSASQKATLERTMRLAQMVVNSRKVN